MSAPELFSLLGPLPTAGRVAIEASAGTGKTYTLAGLVVRYVAEARVPVEELLIVTFTRAAAAELRDRVRSRLSEAAAGAAQPRGHPGRRRPSQPLLAGTDRDYAVSIVSSGQSSTSTRPRSRRSTALPSRSAPRWARQSRATSTPSLLEDTGELVAGGLRGRARGRVGRQPRDRRPAPDTGESFRACAAKVLANPGIRLIPGADGRRVHARRCPASPPRRPRRRRRSTTAGVRQARSRSTTC